MSDSDLVSGRVLEGGDSANKFERWPLKTWLQTLQTLATRTHVAPLSEKKHMNICGTCMCENECCLHANTHIFLCCKVPLSSSYVCIHT